MHTGDGNQQICCTDPKLQTAVAIAFNHTMHITKSAQHSDSLFRCSMWTRRLIRSECLWIAAQPYVGKPAADTAQAARHPSYNRHGVGLT